MRKLFQKNLKIQVSPAEDAEYCASWSRKGPNGKINYDRMAKTLDQLAYNVTYWNQKFGSILRIDDWNWARRDSSRSIFDQIKESKSLSNLIRKELEKKREEGTIPKILRRYMYVDISIDLELLFPMD